MHRSRAWLRGYRVSLSFDPSINRSNTYFEKNTKHPTFPALPSIPAQSTLIYFLKIRHNTATYKGKNKNEIKVNLSRADSRWSKISLWKCVCFCFSIKRNRIGTILNNYLKVSLRAKNQEPISRDYDQTISLRNQLNQRCKIEKKPSSNDFICRLKTQCLRCLLDCWAKHDTHCVHQTERQDIANYNTWLNQLTLSFVCTQTAWANSISSASIDDTLLCQQRSALFFEIWIESRPNIFD